MSSSARKRNKREFPDTSQPSNKRLKVDTDDDDFKLTEEWPCKNHLSAAQQKQLPCIINASLHKAVFESFWNSKKFGAAKIECNETAAASLPASSSSSSSSSPSKSKPKQAQKQFQCVLSCTNKLAPQQTIQVASGVFDARKKAQIDVYKQFNVSYIPFAILRSKMRPFAFKNNASLQQIVSRKGTYLRGQTCTIVMEPLPLHFCEVHVLRLLTTKKKDVAAKDSRKVVQFIEFERDSQKAIFQRAYVQLEDESLATRFVESLNGKNVEQHRVSVTWSRPPRNSKATTAVQLQKKSVYLKCVGFPVNVSESQLMKFLYQHLMEPQRTCLMFRYALIAQGFMQFESVKQSVDALQKLNAVKFGEQKHVLFARYSNEEEYDAAVAYKTDVKELQEQVVRRSKCVDVKNISWDTTEQQLRDIFSECGEIVKLHINADKHLSAGTAFVEFETEESAHKAILQRNGFALNGFELKISMHLKQTRDDKKKMRAWYVEHEERKVQETKQRKIEQLKRKKDKLKRKRIRRAMKQM
mmetsp:Transcript_2775/g.5221  ORF Transcript_2775/g.5221 Transcript_2775/m.5221 type:complete len:527 (+) Transcript_2775:31-1611(+)|eukprot:CAMPEP_0202685558 /NCGR_PEP_ID=MMETSP1385-20130828/1346_1 /ASSEMBLY_ACC=CAM_ASM_000861 /TAXON_ID=933848 /ORGANISM="Elphidium margaritaceum" /LENGTH=526 /DNA_ID=CAMNT_0049339937 /DNA_START=29 /DNA_END=1609 /DNA_ORIENTATION=+